jgi:hypothetical protein
LAHTWITEDLDYTHLLHRAVQHLDGDDLHVHLHLLLNRRCSVILHCCCGRLLLLLGRRHLLLMSGKLLAGRGLLRQKK